MIEDMREDETRIEPTNAEKWARLRNLQNEISAMALGDITDLDQDLTDEYFRLRKELKGF